MHDGIEFGASAGYARVGGSFKVLFQLVVEDVLDFIELRVGGAVDEVGGAVGDEVEFFGGAFAEGEFGEGGLFGSLIPDVGFGGAAVGIAEAACGIVAGPNETRAVPYGIAFGVKVPDIEMVAGANGADGVAGTVGARAGEVAFDPEDGVVAGGVDLAGLGGCEEGHEGAAGHLRRDREAGGFEDCRSEIGERDEVCDIAVGFGFGAPADGEGHVDTVFVHVAFGAWEGEAVVRSDEDEGVVEFAFLFEEMEHFGEVGIEVLDLEGVVGEVLADFGGVGEEGGDFDGLGLLAVVGSNALVEDAVGFEEAGPEAERGVGGTFVEEGGEVGGVVDVGDAWARRREFAVVVFGAGGVGGATGNFPVAWAPGFACEAGVVAGAGENVGVAFEAALPFRVVH